MYCFCTMWNTHFSSWPFHFKNFKFFQICIFYTIFFFSISNDERPQCKALLHNWNVSPRNVPCMGETNQYKSNFPFSFVDSALYVYLRKTDNDGWSKMFLFITYSIILIYFYLKCYFGLVVAEPEDKWGLWTCISTRFNCPAIVCSRSPVNLGVHGLHKRANHKIWIFCDAGIWTGSWEARKLCVCGCLCRGNAYSYSRLCWF